MKYLRVFLVIAMLLLFTVPGFCAQNNFGNTDLNPLLHRLIPTDLMYRGAQRGGVSTIVSQVSKLTSTNLAFGFLWLNGATKRFSIAAGETGQEITLMKKDVDARVLRLDLTIDNPNTAHTGFNSILWPTAAGSYVTLLWYDDTLGWIITGSQGVTIEQ
jgi:hypothetical protein